MVLLEQMRKAAARLLASTAQDDNPLTRYVAEVRDGERAQAARAARRSELWPMEADPEVRLAEETLNELRALPELRLLDERIAALTPKTPVFDDPVSRTLARPEPESAAYREAKELHATFLRAIWAAEGWLTDARCSYREWGRILRRAGLKDLDEQRCALAEQFEALRLQRQQYVAETIALVGHDPAAPSDQFPVLDALAIQRTRRAWAPAPKPARLPPAPGRIRVRVLEVFVSEALGRRLFPADQTGVTGIEDVPEGEAAIAVKRGWAAYA
jgi:hypothetical protein